MSRQIGSHRHRCPRCQINGDCFCAQPDEHPGFCDRCAAIIQQKLGLPATTGLYSAIKASWEEVKK